MMFSLRCLMLFRLMAFRHYAAAASRYFAAIYIFSLRYAALRFD